ncbi:hypothetical protein BXY41_11077 [Lacrimispora xylanisolvens]|uniref:Uncharacterized protein n=1 Tax=Lacrimispora xylanisolvens TaxID=384636 RepID=A0A2S6HP89_9FIRM|nr:hypothetical protein BXY41_11077 [Hungatella xylanolytica]
MEKKTEWVKYIYSLDHMIITDHHFLAIAIMAFFDNDISNLVFKSSSVPTQKEICLYSYIHIISIVMKGMGG